MISLLGIVSAHTPCRGIFPTPKICKAELNKYLLADPCQMVFLLDMKFERNCSFCQVGELIQHYSKKVFKCPKTSIINVDNKHVSYSGSIIQVNIQLANTNPEANYEPNDQAYQLKYSQRVAVLKAEKYVGFVRALQTFSQLFQGNGNGEFFNLYQSVQLKDKPDKPWRGLMIDTSRHYLPIQLIFDTIDSLLYAKMSVLHWHMVDQDSFPFIFSSHPEIGLSGSYSQKQVYTQEDITKIVNYATVRGVKVVPQLDSPAHSASWARNYQNWDIACRFNIGFMGSLDVTWQRSFKVFQDIYRDVLRLFPSKYIHIGGDQYSQACSKNRTQFEKLVQKMRKLKENKSIPDDDYQALALADANKLRYFIARAKKIINKLDSSRKIIIWANSQEKMGGQDVWQFWGGDFPQIYKNTSQKKQKKPVIFSYYMGMYLDTGFNNYLASNYGPYNDWNTYGSFRIQKQDIQLGGQAPLWSQISNEHTHFMKIWVRTGALANRLWNLDLDYMQNGYSLAKHGSRLNNRGIAADPIASQYCQDNWDDCNARGSDD